jgi:DNA-binding LacI/PurR family transcriptional regulator
VVVDNLGGARSAVESLYSLGHRRIGHLTYRRNPSLWIDLRGQAYHETMADFGLTVTDDLIMVGESRDDMGRAVLARFRQPDPPTAIFAVSDYAGITAINSLERFGIHVPADVSIVGFDDGPLAEACRPSLTAVRQPMALLAETALTQLVGMVEGKAPAVRTVLQTHLIVRDSTAPLDAEHRCDAPVKADAAACRCRP